jgi:hypothetical protein
LSWQKRWCTEGKEQKKVACAAALLFVEERDERLGFTDKKKWTNDAVEALNDWMADHTHLYSNWLNRRGGRILPTSLNKATSVYDWDTAIHALLLFASLPNINPKKPLK